MPFASTLRLRVVKAFADADRISIVPTAMNLRYIRLPSRHQPLENFSLAKPSILDIYAKPYTSHCNTRSQPILQAKIHTKQ
jgi:hypothetical protein